MTAVPPSINELINVIKSNRPASIYQLINFIRENEGYQWFLETVDDLMPDQRRYITEATNLRETIDRFQREFESRFFPLLDEVLDEVRAYEGLSTGNDGTGWEYLQECVPIELYGFLMEDPHDSTSWFSPHRSNVGWHLTPLLLDTRYVTYEDDPNIRISWIEAAGQVIVPETIRKIPVVGFHATTALEAMMQAGMTDMVNLILWTVRQCPHEILNIQYGPDEYIVPNISWELESVAAIAEERRAAQPTLASVNRALAWLNQDPNAHFGEVVDAVVEHAASLNTPSRSAN